MRRRARLAACPLLCALVYLSGCAATRVVTDPILGSSFVVTNVFRKEATLPAQIRRVAVLPLTVDTFASGGSAGQQTLEPIFHTELSKTTRFETVFVKPAELKKWTGKERWDYLDVLPPDLLKIVAEQTGADGILFARLSRYHAYPPIVIGWRMTLTAIDADILWSVEETFDAAEESVSNAARRFDRGQARSNPVLEDSRSILLSPSKFGQYTARATVQTLPLR